MHFIPNPTNSEFIYLLGLEECVAKYKNEDKPPGPQPVPFSCSQCHTDFTPTWKWDREKGSKGKNVTKILINIWYLKINEYANLVFKFHNNSRSR